MSRATITTADFPAAIKVTSPLGTTIEANLTAPEFEEVCTLLTKFFAQSEAERVGGQT